MYNRNFNTKIWKISNKQNKCKWKIHIFMLILTIQLKQTTQIITIIFIFNFICMILFYGFYFIYNVQLILKVPFYDKFYK